MSLIQNVYRRTHDVLRDARHVRINDEAAVELARQIPRAEAQQTWARPAPDGLLSLTDRQIVFYELLAGSINYAYWYGCASHYPAGGGSTVMYECLDDAWHKAGMLDPDEIVGEFIANLSERGMPWMEQRAGHLRELLQPTLLVSIDDMLDVLVQRPPLEDALRCLVRNYPGYASDPFLKRASLFFIQLNRILGWWNDEIGSLFVPSDYQVPKILRHFQVLEYAPELGAKIERGEIIPQAGREEAEIRAATIWSCQMIAERSGLRPCDVDTYLWLNRKACNAPFHLTVTTNY